MAGDVQHLAVPEGVCLQHGRRPDDSATEHVGEGHQHPGPPQRSTGRALAQADEGSVEVMYPHRCRSAGPHPFGDAPVVGVMVGEDLCGHRGEIPVPPGEKRLELGQVAGESPVDEGGALILLDQVEAGEDGPEPEDPRDDLFDGRCGWVHGTVSVPAVEPDPIGPQGQTGRLRPPAPIGR